MSRTDKDRPYWVVLNDKTIPKTYEHNHTKFGHYGINYWGKRKYTPDYCTAFEDLTWHTYDDIYYLPCRPREIVSTGGGKWPLDFRLKLYRRRRRDFLKEQVKRFNSNWQLHGDYDFMNDDVFEERRDETSHQPNY